jgi:hypothetical protein
MDCLEEGMKDLNKRFKKLEDQKGKDNEARKDNGCEELWRAVCSLFSCLWVVRNWAINKEKENIPKTRR